MFAYVQVETKMSDISNAHEPALNYTKVKTLIAKLSKPVF